MHYNYECQGRWGTVTSFMCNLYEMYQNNGRLHMQWCKDEMIDCTIVIVCMYNVLFVTERAGQMVYM